MAVTSQLGSDNDYQQNERKITVATLGALGVCAHLCVSHRISFSTLHVNWVYLEKGLEMLREAGGGEIPPYPSPLQRHKGNHKKKNIQGFRHQVKPRCSRTRLGGRQ